MVTVFEPLIFLLELLRPCLRLLPLHLLLQQQLLQRLVAAPRHKISIELILRFRGWSEHRHTIAVDAWGLRRTPLPCHRGGGLDAHAHARSACRRFAARAKGVNKGVLSRSWLGGGVRWNRTLCDRPNASIVVSLHLIAGIDCLLLCVWAASAVAGGYPICRDNRSTSGGGSGAGGIWSRRSNRKHLLARM